MSLLYALLAPAALAATDPESLVYEYRGPEESGSFTALEIVEKVRAAPRAEHLVRGPGASDWTVWSRVPDLARVWMTSAGSDAAVHPVDPGAGGFPPRNAPPDPVDPAAPPRPVPSVPPRAEPAAFPALNVRIGGDVRVDFVAANLERIGGANAVPARFEVNRARPVLDVALGRWLSGRLAVEARQDDSSSTYAVQVDDSSVAVQVDDWANSWSLRGREIYLQAAAGDRVRHRVRVGLQEPAFGVRETYEDTYPLAGDGRAELARATGLVVDEDLGLGWRVEVGDRLAVDVQALDGSGGTALAETPGLDYVARVETTPVDALAVSLSGLFGARGLDGTGAQAQGQLTVEVRGPHQRLLVEGLLGATTEDTSDTFFSGAAASGVWSFPVAGGVIEAVDVVGRFQFYDPVAGMDAPDAWWSPSAGVWARWQVAPGQLVRTGASWDTDVPQDLLLPVTHKLVAEAAWLF